MSLINRYRTKPVVIVWVWWSGTEPNLWWLYEFDKPVQNQTCRDCMAPVNKAHTIIKGLVLHLFIKLIQSPQVWFCTCLSSSYNHHRFGSVPVYQTHTKCMIFINRCRTKPLAIVWAWYTGVEKRLWWVYELYNEVQNQVFGDCMCFTSSCRSQPSSYNHQRFGSVPVYQAHTITTGLVLYLFIKLIQSPQVWFCTCLSNSYNHDRLEPNLSWLYEFDK
jgi:Rieske Fe-S protein